MSDQSQLFDLGAEVAVDVEDEITSQAATHSRLNEAREDFMAGMFAQWAAIDRGGANAKPTAEEKRRGREGAKAALGEFLR